jgi:hypothetical protein
MTQVFLGAHEELRQDIAGLRSISANKNGALSDAIFGFSF